MGDIQFKYFYGNESELFTFYRVPKELITNPRFKHVSNDAKLLYGLMLDRMALSAKNHWFDKDNRVYIYFSVVDVMEQLNIGKNKAIKLLKELDSDSGIGLIEKKQQGQGKPAVIYVKSFVIEDESANSKEFENQTSSSFENKPLEVPEANTNKNKENNTKGDNQSNLIDVDAIDLMEKMREQLGIEALIYDHPEDRELYEEICDLVVETLLRQDKSIVIASSRYPSDLVKRKLQRLSMFHVQYVVDCLSNATSKVRNIKQYMLASMFNAPSTIKSYYQTQVNHDMASGGKGELWQQPD
ncbi:MAG: replication initiator protein A [Lachnospiraceae bacterium]|nr:replication initiator protein A [Lachnospiraceae bacterium]